MRRKTLQIPTMNFCLRDSASYMETKLKSLLSLRAKDPSAGLVLVLEEKDCSCKSNSCTVSAAMSFSANVPKGLKLETDEDFE